MTGISEARLYIFHKYILCLGGKRVNEGRRHLLLADTATFQIQGGKE